MPDAGRSRRPESEPIRSDAVNPMGPRPIRTRGRTRATFVMAAFVGAVILLDVPETLLIDRDGREIGRISGPADWSGEGARSMILRHVQGDVPRQQLERAREPAA